MIAVGKPIDLKMAPEVNPPGTARFELTCREPATALAIARHSLQFRDATMFGDTLHLLASNQLGPDDVVRLICPDDATATIRPIGPSLEDAFVLMSRSRTAEAAA